MILMSACLAGIPCRYDGKAKTVPELEKLYHENQAVPVCPEVLGGLNVPRKPAEIRNGRVYTENGTDVSKAYEKGSRKALEICKENHCVCAILKEKSPACGVHQIYDGSFTDNTVEGHGILTSLLEKNGISCFDEYEFKEKMQ